jgi:hypothetical protein
MSQPFTHSDAVAHGHTENNQGDFRYDVTEDRWWWSDTTYRIHGFEPGDVVPTTALVLAHKHPDDRHRVYAILAEACRTGESFVSVHRIMDATGRTRHMVLTGHGSRFDGDQVTELAGWFTEITDRVTSAATTIADEQIRGSAQTRSTIEQAKGVLAVALGINPEAAFERLRDESMRANVPVRRLAERLVERAPLLHVLRDDDIFSALS